MRRWIVAVAIMIASAASHSLIAQTRATKKEAWEWSEDERIAARLDPDAIKQRATAHLAHAEGQSEHDAGDRFVIDGKENPELFLPFELFTSLVSAVDPSLTERDRGIHRALFEPGLVKMGYDPAKVWKDLQASAAMYFAARELARKSDTTEDSSAAQVRICRARYDSIKFARDRFGGNAFDRLLYTVVAPTLTTVGAVPGAGEGNGLRYLSAGCQ